MDRVEAVILAAGTSSRMGRPKQLIELHGRLLVQHVVDAAAASCVDSTVVVLGGAADQVQASLELSSEARTVFNERFADGQASSLHTGLEACAPETRAAVVLLGDQPDIASALIDEVVIKWRSERTPIVRCTFMDGPGHPVLLAREVWDQLDTKGDAGARTLIARRPDLVADVRVPVRALRDFDTPADLRELE